LFLLEFTRVIIELCDVIFFCNKETENEVETRIRIMRNI